MGDSSPRSFATFLRDYVYLPAYKLTSIDEDELFRLQSMQECLTAFRQLKNDRPWKEARQALDQTVVRVSKVTSSAQQFRYWFSRTSIPNFSKAANITVRNETERRMTVVAIALKRFQLRHEHLPSSLRALVPEILSELPLDPMSAEPFCYQLRNDGTALLYSVGEDGRDDGGDSSPTSGQVLGLWSGRDAVWPSPTTEAAGGVNTP